MKRLRLLAAVTGSACTLLTGAMALAGPASAAPISPHPKAHVAPRDGLPTDTTLALTSAGVDFDQEPIMQMDGFVTGGGHAVTSGSVTMRTFLADGTRVDLCHDDSLTSGGLGACFLTAGQLPPGTYQITAHYSGVLGSIEASDSPSKQLVVATAPTTMSLSVANRTLAYGQEGDPNEFTMQVTPRTSGLGTPTGTLSVTDFCSKPAVNGGATCGLSSSTALPPGTYNVAGAYSANPPYRSTTAGVQQLTVTRGHAITTLTVQHPRVAFSQQGGDQLTVNVAPAGGGIPGGKVDITDRGFIICEVTLTNGTGTCNLSAGVLAIGSHTLTASYAGDSHFAAADPATADITITKETATPSLTLAPSQVTFGHEQAETLSINVTGGSGPPTGLITILDGSKALTTLSYGGGTVTKSLTATQLGAGSHQLSVSYSGDSTYAAATSAASTLTVAREPTSTTLTLSRAKIKAGSEQAEHLAVTVKPKFAGTPAGKVTIKAGTTTLCTITLKNAKGTCTLSKSKLRPGTYHLTASYPATASYLASASARKTLTVTR